MTYKELLEEIFIAEKNIMMAQGEGKLVYLKELEKLEQELDKLMCKKGSSCRT